METRTKIKKIESYQDITFSFKMLSRELNDILWCCMDFPDRMKIMNKYSCKFYPLRKTLKVEPFKNGIVENVNLSVVEVEGISLCRVESEELKDILSHLILNNLNLMSIEGLLANKSYLRNSLGMSVFNKLELIEKLKK